jgi:hypothetical protein
MSKRKANNAHKRAERVCKAALKNCAIVFLAGGDNKCHLVDVRTHKVFSPTLALSRVIEKGRYSWSVYCAVFCRDQNGQEYMPGIVVVPDHPCLQSELQEGLHNHHLKLLHPCNANHTVNVGWLASPVGRDWCEEEVGKIFSKLNAWDFNTKLENDGV